MSLKDLLFDYMNSLALKSERECRQAELLLLEKNQDAEFLDLGCADGLVTLEAANIIGTDRLFGVDIVTDDANKAAERGITIHQGNLNLGIPYEDNRFDIVLASHVIEHLSDTDIFVREAFRVLKPGGYFLVATPNLASWTNIMYLILGKQPPTSEVSDTALVGTWSPRGNDVDREGPAHRRIFTAGALKGLLGYYGFRVERTVHSGYFPLTSYPARFMEFVCRWHTTNSIVKARKP